MHYVRHFFILFFWSILSVAPAKSATFPDRPIELIIPYPPGGPNDVIGRVLGEQMSKVLGQPVVVKNQAGAGGNLAAANVARAKPDGYTLLLPAMAYAVNPFIFKQTNYAFKDFQAVSMVVQGPLVLVVHPSTNIKTVSELIQTSKQNPGQIKYASGGVGSSLHLAGELFKNQAGIDMMHVPYKGTGELMPDLLAGRVDALFSSPLTVRQHVEQNKLLALGVTGTGPVNGWDNVPPIAKTLPGFEMFAWYSLMAPAGLPNDVLMKLNAAVQTAQQSPEFVKKMEALGMEITLTSPAQATAFINKEIDKWRNLVKQANITAN